MSDLKIKRLFVSFWNPKTKQRDRLWFPDEARRQAFLADLRADYPLSSLAPQIWDDEIDEQQTGLPQNPGSNPEGSKGTGSREVRWTPGPWSAQWDDNGYWYIEPLGITGTKLRGDSGECLESANARLLAAAPELYEALTIIEWEPLREFLKAHYPNQAEFALKAATEALAKARGEL